jgi:hypothetical protein
MSFIQWLVKRISHQSAEDARLRVIQPLASRAPSLLHPKCTQTDELVTCGLIFTVLILVAKSQRNFRGTNIWTSTKCMIICMM